ncbi:DUF5906 domain-containing protein [Dyella acidisoli]|uniref:Primase C-terminal 2 domain-containing protein n=1 Tax=Dyella acidisoli TaxID=1867834 RepID=A0ABQ5XWL4_9GAMM|nr:DUF5906 domain-containing protein [Dyella acidisoli]GLQ95147.1 hypothetical protein GCM10007901_41020 [Dyella acidisoli]
MAQINMLPITHLRSISPTDLEMFLKLVLPVDGPYWTLAYQHPSRVGSMLHASFTSIEAMVAKCKELDASGMEVWHAVASYTQPTKESRGRTKANVAHLKSFFLDIDVDPLKPVKAYATREDAERALTEFVRVFGEPYHLAVHSGGGLHVYWLLDESILRDEWERVALKFQDAIKLAGLLADSSRTTDAASLLRPAGTTNKKSKYGDKGQPVVAYRSRFGDMALEEFEEACDQLRSKKLAIEGVEPPRGVVETGVTVAAAWKPSWYDELPDEVKVQTLRSMLEALPIEQTISRDDWLAVGMALACEGHLSHDITFPLWANWSQSTPEGADSWREDSEEQQRRRYEGFNRSGVGALITRAYKAGWYPGLLHKNDEGSIAHNSVVAAHKSSGERFTIEQAKAYLKDNVIYVSTENTYIHDGLSLPKESFNTVLGSLMPRTKRGNIIDASTLVKEGAAVFADYADYKPGFPRIFADSDKRVVVNTYEPLDLEPSEASPEDMKTFGEYLNHLSGNSKETKAGIRSVLVKYGYLYMHPSKRIRQATVLVGKVEGSGKSTLMQTIPTALFGVGNVHCVENREVNSNFNGYAQGARILVFPELWLGNRRDAEARANELKPLISDNRISVTKKFRESKGVDNVTTIFASSNYVDAAFFGLYDRRYHVISTDAPQMPPDLARRIHDLIENRPGSLLWMVLKIWEKYGADFDPDAPAPQTKAKKEMLEANRSEWAQWMHDSFESRAWPFNGDAVAVDDVKTAMGERFRPMPSDAAIRNELSNIVTGSTRMQAMRKMGGKKTESKRVFVLRNIQSWIDAGPSALYDHYVETVIKCRSATP